jgi:uncharacterized protein YyaL (SSP411 family)
MTTNTNSLADETSPYLLQHARNPVDWHAWKPAALNKAREMDKPILLSIGYAACHWCHVMEHESFEDPATAQIMNEHFICIKVDREERPDLDKIYQTAHQMLTGRPGGWPLNMFLMPDDHMPFFGGTYFPDKPRYGMPAFAELLERVASYYHNNRPELEQQNRSLVDAFSRISRSKQDGRHHDLDHAPVDKALLELRNSYDPVYGGFGAAPKFPHPTNLERCLRSSIDRDKDNKEITLAEIVHHTLSTMSNGGVNDQVNGGFYRYSVDEYWMIPHFEKMLYDNAQLIPLYVDAGIAFNDDALLATANRTCGWVMNEMQSPEGGYYSSLDADSEGEEGRYYVWTTGQLRTLLDDHQWQIAEMRYGLNGEANFEGRWHLHVHQPIADIAATLSIDSDSVARVLDTVKDVLRQDRSGRVRPGLDDKILTSWNGMMIHAMAHCGRLLGRQDCIDSAQRALDFLDNKLWDGERLLATYRDGQSQLNAYLDDYVHLATGILELLQVRWSDEQAEMLVAIMDTVLKHFEDEEHGGFFFTSDDHEKLLQRIKPDADDAIPSGNGIAVQLLIRLGHLFGNQRYLASAERALSCLWDNMNNYAAAHGALLTALDLWLAPPEILVIRGQGQEAESWKSLAVKRYAPDRMVFTIPVSAAVLPGLLSGKQPGDGIIAYPCKGTSCLPPVSTYTGWQAYLSTAT